MQLPSDQDLRALGPQRFSNEIEVQRFFEDYVLEKCGLQWICSSVRGRGRIGFVDTIAVDGTGDLVIIEYKWDMVDRHTVQQIRRYCDRLPAHSQELDDAFVARRWPTGKIDLTRLKAITVGHRYHPSVVLALPPHI